MFEQPIDSFMFSQVALLAFEAIAFLLINNLNSQKNDAKVRINCERVRMLERIIIVEMSQHCPSTIPFTHPEDVALHDTFPGVDEVDVSLERVDFSIVCDQSVCD